MPLTINLNNLQKVEFLVDATKCNVSFSNYTAAGGRTLLITDVPAGAGTMLASVNSGAFFIQPGSNPAPTVPPVVFVAFNNADVVTDGGGNTIDSVEYGGRIELREF